jgi:hypothetical protein
MSEFSLFNKYTKLYNSPVYYRKTITMSEHNAFRNYFSIFVGRYKIKPVHVTCIIYGKPTRVSVLVLMSLVK